MFKGRKTYLKYLLNNWSKNSVSIHEMVRNKSKIQKSKEEQIQRILKGKRMERVLDVSCGSGYIDYTFRENIINLFCVDIYDFVDKDLLDNEFNSFEFSEYNGLKIPYDSEYFDLVWHFDVLEHVKNDEEFLLENLRVCRTDGFLIFGTPNLNRISSIPRKIANLFRSEGPVFLGTDEYGDCIHEREYSYLMLENLCHKLFVTGYSIIPCYVGLPLLRYFGININAGFKKVPKFFKEVSYYWLVVYKKTGEVHT